MQTAAGAPGYAGTVCSGHPRPTAVAALDFAARARSLADQPGQEADRRRLVQWLVAAAAGGGMDAGGAAGGAGAGPDQGQRARQEGVEVAIEDGR